jgi:hypothetical protein
MLDFGVEIVNMSEEQALYGTRPHLPGGVRFRQILKATANSSFRNGLRLIELENEIKRLEQRLDRITTLSDN